MSMLSIQIDKLRDKAQLFEGYQNGEISAMLRDAADTIESLQERAQECSTCKERQGYYLDAETIQNQHEHIAELMRENERLRLAGYEIVYHDGAKRIADLERLVRDCLSADCHVCVAYMDEHPCKHIEESGCGLLRRMKDLGIEVDS